MRAFVLLLALCIGWCGTASAQYVLVLKNGRQIPVQSYREEGSTIRFYGQNGEAAIGKDQVQSVRRAGESELRAAEKFAADRVAPPPSSTAPGRVAVPETKPAAAPPMVSGDSASAGRAEEERAYQEKLRDLTRELKELREQYGLLTTGNAGPEPKFFTTEKEFRSHQEDLLSRLRDAQYKAQGLPYGENATSPPFSLDAPPAYTENEKKLSDMRRRMRAIEDQREKLINEMKLKNFDTGFSFLD